jgi:hypothetical protein
MDQSDRTTQPQTLLSEQIPQSGRRRAARLRPMREMSMAQRVGAMRRGELTLAVRRVDPQSH